MMTIEEMRILRRDLGISYHELAIRAGLSFGTVQRVFGGKACTVRRTTLEKLDRAFEQYKKIFSFPLAEERAGRRGKAIAVHEETERYVLKNRSMFILPGEAARS